MSEQNQSGAETTNQQLIADTKQAVTDILFRVFICDETYKLTQAILQASADGTKTPEQVQQELTLVPAQAQSAAIGRLQAVLMNISDVAFNNNLSDIMKQYIDKQGTSFAAPSVVAEQQSNQEFPPPNPSDRQTFSRYSKEKLFPVIPEDEPALEEPTKDNTGYKPYTWDEIMDTFRGISSYDSGSVSTSASESKDDTQSSEPHDCQYEINVKDFFSYKTRPDSPEVWQIITELANNKEKYASEIERIAAHNAEHAPAIARPIGNICHKWYLTPTGGYGGWSLKLETDFYYGCRVRIYFDFNNYRGIDLINILISRLKQIANGESVPYCEKLTIA